MLLKADAPIRDPSTNPLAASISTLAQAATVLLMGCLGDRFGRRWVLMASLALSIVGDGIALAAPNACASGLGGTMVVVALVVAVLGAISLLLLVIGQQQGRAQR